MGQPNSVQNGLLAFANERVPVNAGERRLPAKWERTGEVKIGRREKEKGAKQTTARLPFLHSELHFRIASELHSFSSS